MTGREFGGLLALLTVAVTASYAFAPGGSVLVLVVGMFAVVVADHRVTERRSARANLRERLVEAARRNENGGHAGR